MAFSGTTYSEISAGAFLIDDLIKDYRDRLSAAKQEPGLILSSLTAFGVEWGPIVDAANAIAAADPTNIAKQNLASHISNLVTDYAAVLADAQAFDTAIAAIP